MANPGLSDAEKLIVSVTILNYFWAFGDGDGTVPLFTFSDAKDHFHVCQHRPDAVVVVVVAVVAVVVVD